MSSSPTYLDPVIVPLIRGNTLLDVGCGYGRWGNLIRSNFWEAGLKQPPTVDGFDAFQPNVDYCSQNSAYNKVWQQTLPSVIVGQWDTILACEILEHLPQESVEEVLATLESHAAQRVIFSTPNWPYFREGGETIVGYNQFEAHLSYTPRALFRGRGYKVISVGFGNPKSYLIRVLNRMKINFSPSSLETMARLFPSLGQSIIAYKDVTN